MTYPVTMHYVIPDTVSSNEYLKYRIHIIKRNFSLIGIPTLYYLVRDGKRDYLGETYSRVKYTGKDIAERYTNIRVSTVYNNHAILDILTDFLTPDIYDVNVFKDFILSPVVRQNMRFYSYESMPWGDGTRFFIHPKVKNTQLVWGYIDVDNKTGKINNYVLEGRYNMVHFVLSASMGTDEWHSLLPSHCKINADMHITGNHIVAEYSKYFNLQETLPDSIHNSMDVKRIETLRPEPLSTQEQYILNQYETDNQINEVVVLSNPQKAQRRKKIKHILWDIIGDKALNSIHADLGNEKQGHLKIGPIFNPLYFGYTRGKGIIYKFDTKGNYSFTKNSSINFRTKMGYSFKQKHLYYKIPINYIFNSRRNGYIHFEFGNGNRITNSKVLDEIKNERNDSINWDNMHLDYFKDMKLQLSVNYDVLKDMLGVQGGVTMHRRTGVNRDGLKAAGKPDRYNSSAPFVQLQFRPFGDKGAIYTAEYERSIKGLLNTDVSYERMEFDFQYIHKMECSRNLQMRCGTGFYTNRSHGDYFLDYHNFQENYIPNGWNDEWTGEFEMLNSNWYNASKYYFRANLTFESPLLILSFCPIIGNVIEKERIYASTLAVHNLWPYTEIGYGFVNKFFSMGLFCGIAPHNFEGIGMKFGFELFNNW